MLIPVSSLSTSSYSSHSVINPELLNKESLLKELNTQAERIAIAKKRKADEINLSDEKPNSNRNKNNADKRK